MKCLIALLVLPLFLNAQDTISTGLIDPCPDEIAKYVTPGSPVLSTKLIDPPKSCDLSKFIPAIGNQGVQGSCTAFAVAEALTILDNQKKKRKFSIHQLQDFNYFYSPAFIFNVGKSKYPVPRSEKCEDGISYIDAFLVARDYGCSPWHLAVYNPSGTAGCSSNYYPSDKAFKEAKKNKIITFQKPDLDVNVFKCLLADEPGYPICIAAYIDKEYLNASYKKNGNALWLKKGGSTGLTNNRHAMLIVGYADSINCFKVLDSRGYDRGDDGFIWMSYDLLRNNTIYDAYVCAFDGELLKSQKSTGEAEIQLNEGSIATSWLKEGYYRTFNGFRIWCRKVDVKNQKAVYRIIDNHTDEPLTPSVTLNVNQQKYFNIKDKTLSIFLKGFERKGKNIFNKASVFDISITGEKLNEEFVKRGSTKEDVTRLFYLTYVSQLFKKAYNDDNSVYIGFNNNYKIGDVVNSDNELKLSNPVDNMDSLGLIHHNGIVTTTFDHSYDISLIVDTMKNTNSSLNDSIRTSFMTFHSKSDFHLNYFLEALSAKFDDSLTAFLKNNTNLEVTSVSWSSDVSRIGSSLLDSFLNSKNTVFENYSRTVMENDSKIITELINLDSLEGRLKIKEPPSKYMLDKLKEGIIVSLKNGNSKNLAMLKLSLSDKGDDIKISLKGKWPFRMRTEKMSFYIAR
jgi:hypothetical protein